MEDTGKKSYRICQISWCLLLPVIMLWLEVRRMGFQTDMLLKLYPPCIFRRVTGMYCPGCGGTRAVVELLKGNILRSLWYHPVVVYTAGLYGWYLISNTIEWISGKDSVSEADITDGMEQRRLFLLSPISFFVIFYYCFFI